MKSFKELAHDLVTKVDEDAPANAVGTGANVALPPTHEPGVKKKKKKKHDPILINNLKRKVQENNDNNSMMLKGVLDKLEQLDDIVDEVSGVKKEIIGQVEETPQYTTFKDKYMNGELLTEGGLTIGAIFEQVIAICHTLYGKGEEKFKNEILNNTLIQSFIKKAQSTKEAYAVKGKSDEEQKDILWNFGKVCRDALGSGKVDAGVGQTKLKISDPWHEEVFKSKMVDTAKTDILVNGLKTSVKGPKALLSSGEKKEARATVICALASTKAATDLEEDLLDACDNLLERTRTVGTVTVNGKIRGLNSRDLKKMTPDEVVGTANEEAHKAAMAQDAAKKGINDAFKTAFNKPEIATAFARETMMGYEKFGGLAYPKRTGGDESGMATHMLIWEYSMTKMKFVKIDDSFCKSIGSKMSVDCSLKSNSYDKKGVKGMPAGYSFYQAFKLEVKTATDEFDKVKKQANEEIEYHKQLLSEGTISEFKFLDKIKQIALKVFDTIKSVFTALYERVKKLVGTVKTLIKEGINLALFELDVDVKFNKEVSFNI